MIHILVLELVPKLLNGKCVKRDIQVLSHFESVWRAMKCKVVMKACLYSAKELDVHALFHGEGAVSVEIEVVSCLDNEKVAMYLITHQNDYRGKATSQLVTSQCKNFANKT